MKYQEVDILIPNQSPFREIIVAKFNEVGFESFSEDEHNLKAYIQEDKLVLKDVEAILNSIKKLTKISYKIKKIKQENWNEKWESNYFPVIINDICAIRAPFHKKINCKYELIIMPKMSFGTGHHETTELMIKQILNLNFKNKNVLDVGCGTGVLSILASKLSANQVTGIDTDDWAFQNSIDNSKLNNVDHIHFFHGDVHSITKNKYDYIFANINLNTIIDQLLIYINLITSKGSILISGFYEENEDIILTLVKKLKLKVVTKKNKNKWLMLHLSK
tara:strand:+ start:6915 stop:7742 length:828 start_codon:yes stop_codon:yes gene_type:complete